MAIQHFELILYVANQQRSRDFYHVMLGLEPSLDVPGMTEFEIGETKLGLMPSRGIKKLLGDAINDPELANGIPRCELYLNVDDPQAYLQRALDAGATELSPLLLRDWGEEAAYVSDFDSHVIAFAKKENE